MKSPRRYARIKAFQTLFQLSSNDQSTAQQALAYAVSGSSLADGDFTDILENVIAQKLSAGKKVAQDTSENIKQLIKGVREQQGVIDELIEKHLHQWRLERLDLVTLTLLRLATYELINDPKISANIIMNEYIEIAKIFSDEQMSKFINGVLQGIVDEKRA